MYFNNRSFKNSGNDYQVVTIVTVLSLYGMVYYLLVLHKLVTVIF